MILGHLFLIGGRYTFRVYGKTNFSTHGKRDYLPTVSKKPVFMRKGTIMEWKILEKHSNDSNFFINEELKDINKTVLITYESPKGRKYVTTGAIDHGRLVKKINGEPIAFMFMPKPY